CRERYNPHMPHVDKHKPGSFNWLELGTTDQEAAKKFYIPLFGWTATDFPMGPNGVYTMFQLDGRDLAGCYQIGPWMPGVPPNWGLFIATENADETAVRGEQLGGKVLRPCFDVYTFGRMAVIQDSTGAVFCVWQPKSHMGTGVTGANGTLCWADLNTPDREKAKVFYEGLFGWRISPGQGKPATDYLHIQNGDDY